MVGAPDDYRGETVKAFCILQTGLYGSAEDIQAWCRQYLFAYKVPTLVEFRSDFKRRPLAKYCAARWEMSNR